MSTASTSPRKAHLALCLCAALVASVNACSRATGAETSQPGTSATRRDAPTGAPAANTVHGAPSSTSRALPRPAPTTLKLASWNLAWLSHENLHGPIQRRPRDYARLARYAKALDADIVAVQEVASTQALARVFDETRYAFHLTADGKSQNTGFVYAKHLEVEVLPDYTTLAAGELRSGADIRVRFEHLSLRLLSVHLKSGCFDAPLSASSACVSLGAQVPKLEAWMDDRAREATAFGVLGDFNRRLFGQPNDAVWRALDDSTPPESDVDSPTRGQRSTCWGAQHPQFIDHLVLSRSLSVRVVPGSFEQVTYAPEDAPFRRQLSDHCPIAVTLTLQEKPEVLPTVTSRVEKASPPIKGNISRKGKRLYHTVDCPQYERVRIEPEKGERYFASELEARAAGFELAPGCRK